jgi:hypothetical protein
MFSNFGDAWENVHTPRDRSVCPYALGDHPFRYELSTIIPRRIKHDSTQGNTKFLRRSMTTLKSQTKIPAASLSHRARGLHLGAPSSEVHSGIERENQGIKRNRYQLNFRNNQVGVKRSSSVLYNSITKTNEFTANV